LISADYSDKVGKHALKYSCFTNQLRQYVFKNIKYITLDDCEPLFLFFFHSSRNYVVRKTGAENRRQKMESIFGAGFWGVCHGY